MHLFHLLWASLLLATALTPLQARAQARPYIGFVYPAGGQQGTTFQVKIGGQGIDDLTKITFTGSGVSAKIVEYHRALNPQEVTLLNEQLKELKRTAGSGNADAMMSGGAMMSDTMMSDGPAPAAGKHAPGTTLAGSIEKRLAAYVNRPACAALAHIAYLEVTINHDAPVGQREVRLVTAKGISNPMVFHVGQLPEFCRKAMNTAPLQVLGKEELALRKRPPAEAEEKVTLPCVMNGQVASGEVNRHRFSATKGQRLVFNTHARQLIPYIADAVPGWFQPVLALYDSKGREVAYSDDYRFRPDPTILFEVPADGEYVLAIYDAIYRGREDFVYRISAGELPFITSIFPLGARTNASSTVKMTGWNLGTDALKPPVDLVGLHWLRTERQGLFSMPVPFSLSALPDALDQEPNNRISKPQKVQLPIIVNGRVDSKDDWDVYQFTGRSNQTLVVEVLARRLDSPLDAVVKLTDASGKTIALNDDCEDLGSGINTHHADPCLSIKLPKDGSYFIHLGDTARNGGPEYGYRLRLSQPQPDFELRAVPSSISLRSKSSAAVSVHVIRKDGFTGPIKVALQNPPTGFTASPVTLSGTQAVARLNIKTDLVTTPEPVTLAIAGTAKIQDRDVTRQAVPAEDRMQAFFWRHFVPANDFQVLVFDPNYQLEPKRTPPLRPEIAARVASVSESVSTNKPKFTKQQVAGRLRQLKSLYQEGLLTDTFYSAKVDECEAVQ